MAGGSLENEAGGVERLFSDRTQGSRRQQTSACVSTQVSVLSSSVSGVFAHHANLMWRGEEWRGEECGTEQSRGGSSKGNGVIQVTTRVASKHNAGLSKESLSDQVTRCTCASTTRGALLTRCVG